MWISVSEEMGSCQRGVIIIDTNINVEYYISIKSPAPAP